MIIRFGSDKPPETYARIIIIITSNVVLASVYAVVADVCIRLLINGAFLRVTLTLFESEKKRNEKERVYLVKT